MRIRTGRGMHTTIMMGIIIITTVMTMTMTMIIITIMVTIMVITTTTTIIMRMITPIMTTRLAMRTATPTTIGKCTITGTGNRPGSLSWRPESWPRMICSRPETVPGLPAAKSSL